MVTRVSLYSGVIAICLLAPTSVMSAPTLLDALGAPRTEITCGDIPSLERGKFEDCRTRWIAVQLDEYANDIAKLRKDRIEREQNAVWAWLEIQPVQDCAAVPPLEIAKFPFCNDDFDDDFDGGSDEASFVARYENGLEQVRDARAQLAESVDGLKARLKLVQDRQQEMRKSFVGPSDAELAPLLDRLRYIESQIRLLELMNSVDFSDEGLRRVVSMRMAQAQTAVPIRAAASQTAPVLATTRRGDAFVVIATADTQTDFIPVLHAITGLGYVARADLEQ